MRRILFFILASLVGIVCLPWFAKRTSLVDHCLSYLMYPVVLYEQKIIKPIADYRERTKIMNGVFDAYQKLSNENSALRAENNQLHALLSEARAFEELLDYKQRYRSCVLIPAQIMVKHFDADEHFFFINKGLQHGLHPDMLVVYQNALIGRVLEVYPWFSKVLCITDMRCKIPAICCKSKIQGIHQGTHTTQMSELTLVSHLEEPLIDDLVITRGEGLIYPKGFALGRIVSCEKKGLHYRIQLKPCVDLATISVCYVTHRESEYLSISN